LTPAVWAQFVVKPYVQLGGDRQLGSRKSLAVVWHAADRKANWSVRVSSGGQTGEVKSVTYQTIKRGIVPAHRVYMAHLSNLSPGLPVKYEVRLDGKRVFSGSAVAPKSEGQSFRFAVTGDTGAGTSAQKKTVYAIHNKKPDFVAVAGDIVYPRGTIADYRSRFFPIVNADRASASIGAPSLRSTLWIAAPGNHDTGYRTVPGGLAFYDYWIQPFGGPVAGCFTFEYGNAHWTVLDSNPYIDWSKGRYKSWLEVSLMAGKRSKWSFVLFHHPPYQSSPTHAGDTFMRKVAHMFTENGVDIVFAGHVHNYQRSNPIHTTARGWSLGQGPIYIVTGAGGADLYDQKIASDRKKWKPFTAAYKAGYSYTLVDVKGGLLTLKQVDLSGKVIDQLRLNR
jgi:hypothetical protein